MDKLLARLTKKERTQINKIKYLIEITDSEEVQRMIRIDFIIYISGN